MQVELSLFILNGEIVFMVSEAMRSENEGARALLRWYRSAKRPFPWRETGDPYKIWISEVMLQQTQTSRAAEYYRKWTELFPDVRSLAAADTEKLLKAWEGLGYYSRARNLQKAAKELAESGSNSLPADYSRLLALPGVGPYTAGAVASIAFGIPVPAIDANGRRVFSRLLDLEEPADRPAGERAIRDTFSAMIPGDAPGDFNQAVMELGATLCLPRTASCAECPLTFLCLSHIRGTELLRPVLSPKEQGRSIEGHLFVFLRKDRVYLRKRPGKGLWAGFEEFPWEAPPAEASLGIPDSLIESGTDMGTVRCSFTRWRVRLRTLLIPLGEQDDPPLSCEGRWVGSNELAALPLSSAGGRARKKLFGRAVIPCPARSGRAGDG